MDNPFPRIHVHLMPVMTSATRSALRRLQTAWMAHNLTAAIGTYPFLTIIRSVLETRKTYDVRVRRGIDDLAKLVGLVPMDVQKALRNGPLMMKHGIILPTERPHAMQIITAMGDIVKALNKPVTRSAIMTDALERDRQRDQEWLGEFARRRKRHEDEEDQAKRQRARELEEEQEKEEKRSRAERARKLAIARLVPL